MSVNDGRVTLVSHYELLETVIGDQLGPVAARIVRVLSNHGALTLKEICIAVQRDTSMNGDVQSSSSAPTSSFARSGGCVGSALYIDVNTQQEQEDALTRSMGEEGHHHSSDVQSALVADAAMKEVVARLVLHRVVAYDAMEHTYALQIGYGLLLRVLFPLLSQCVRRRYGEAGEVVLLVLHQLALIPFSSCVQLAQERRPELAESVQCAAAELVRDGWIECVAGGAFIASRTAADMEKGDGTPHRKRHRDDQQRTADSFSVDTGHPNGSSMGPLLSSSSATGGSGGLSAVDSDSTCRICVQVAIREMMHDAVQQLVSERYGSGTGTCVASSIVTALVRLGPAPVDAASSSLPTSSGATVMFGYPARPPPLSAPVAAHALVDGVLRLRRAASSSSRHEVVSPPSTTPDIIASALQRLTLPSSTAIGADALVVRDGSSGTHRHRGSSSSLHGVVGDTSWSYRFAYSAAATAMQVATCERVVLSRHGVLGVRIMRLLLKNRFLEDRTIAEEAIATQPKTRETLHAMFRDGLLTQQEVPKTSALADRVPKSSVFLWGCSLHGTLVPTCRQFVAKSLTTALAKLREESRRQQLRLCGVELGVVDSGLATPIITPTPAGTHRSMTVTSTATNFVSGGGANGVAAAASTKSTEAVRVALQACRVVAGLQSCALSLMRALAVLDFF